MKNKKVVAHKPDHKGLKSFLTKLLVIAFLILIVWYFRKEVVLFIKGLPIIGPLYIHISDQIINKTLLGLFYASFLGAMFFVTLPVEAIFIYYLSLHHNVFFIIAVAFIGNMLGMIFNYSFGFFLGKGFIKGLVKNNHDRFKGWIEKFGGVILVIGNIIPFPIEPLSLMYGGFKYDFKTYTILTAIGKIIKFIALAIIFFYFLDKIPMIKEWLI